jgi:hypothetical protein
MNLLEDQAILDLYGRAREAGLAMQRDQLLSGFGVGFVSDLELRGRPSEQLLLDLRDLNARLRPFRGDLPLRRWLLTAAALRAAFPAESDYYRGLAEQLAASAEPSITEVARSAQSALQSVQQSAGGSDWLPTALAAARSDLTDLLDRLFLLAMHKRFHDILHKFQMERLPSIQNQVTRDILRDPQRRAILMGEVKAAGTPVADLRKALADLEGKPEQAEARTWIDAFDGQRLAIEAAVDAGAFEAVADGLRELRYLVKSSMSTLNLALGDASLLPISEVAESLREVAATAPEPGDPSAIRLRETATKLVELQKEIEGLVRTHHVWQQVDDELWQLEGSLIFDSDRPQALANVPALWKFVIKRLLRLAGEPAQPWLAQTSAHQVAFERFCPMPIVPPLAEGARYAFSNFTWVTRQQFLELDGQLDGRCKQLVAIARPLNELVKTP